MKWTDSEDIGIALFLEKFPAVDPLTVRGFTDLREKVMQLDGFDDGPKARTSPSWRLSSWDDRNGRKASRSHRSSQPHAHQVDRPNGGASVQPGTGHLAFVAWAGEIRRQDRHQSPAESIVDVSRLPINPIASSGNAAVHRARRKRRLAPSLCRGRVRSGAPHRVVPQSATIRSPASAPTARRRIRTCCR